MQQNESPTHAGSKRGRSSLSGSTASMHMRSVSMSAFSSALRLVDVPLDEEGFSQGPRAVRRKLSASPNENVMSESLKQHQHQGEEWQRITSDFRPLGFEALSSSGGAGEESPSQQPQPGGQPQQPRQPSASRAQPIQPHEQEQKRPQGQQGQQGQQPSNLPSSASSSSPPSPSPVSERPLKTRLPVQVPALVKDRDAKRRHKRSASAPVALPSVVPAPACSSPIEPSSLSLADVSAMDSLQLAMEEDIATEELRLFGDSDENEVQDDEDDEDDDDDEGDEGDAAMSSDFKSPEGKEEEGTGGAPQGGLRIASLVPIDATAPLSSHPVEAEEGEKTASSSTMLTAQPLSPRTPLPTAALHLNLNHDNDDGGEGEKQNERRDEGKAVSAALPVPPPSYAFFLRSAATTAPPQKRAIAARRVRFHHTSKRHDSVFPIHASFDRLAWDFCGGRLNFGPFVTLPFPDCPPLLDAFTCFTPAVAAPAAAAGPPLSSVSSSLCLSATSGVSAASSDASSSIDTGGLFGWHWSPSVAAAGASAVEAPTAGGNKDGAVTAVSEEDDHSSSSSSASAAVLFQGLGASSHLPSLYRLCAASHQPHHRHHGALRHEGKAWPLSAAELASVFGRLSSLVHTASVLSSYSAELNRLIALLKGLEDHRYNEDFNGEGSGEESEQVDISVWLGCRDAIGGAEGFRGLITADCKRLPPVAHVNTAITSGNSEPVSAAISWLPGDMCVIMSAVAEMEEEGEDQDGDAKRNGKKKEEGEAMRGEVDVFVQPLSSPSQPKQEATLAGPGESALAPPPGLSRIRAARGAAKVPSPLPGTGPSFSSQPPHPFRSPSPRATFLAPLLRHLFESERYGASDPLKLRGMLTLAEALEYRLKLAVVRRVGREVASAINSLRSVLESANPAGGQQQGRSYDFAMVSAARNALGEIDHALREAFGARSFGDSDNGVGPFKRGSSALYRIPFVSANRDKTRTWLDAAYQTEGIEGFAKALEAFAKHGSEEDEAEAGSLADDQGHRHHQHHDHHSHPHSRHRHRRRTPVPAAADMDEEDDGYKSDSEGGEGESEGEDKPAAAASSPSSLRPCIKSAVAASPIASPALASGQHMVIPSPSVAMPGPISIRAVETAATTTIVTTSGGGPSSPFVFGRSGPHGGLGAASVVLRRISLDDLPVDDDEGVDREGNGQPQWSLGGEAGAGGQEEEADEEADEQAALQRAAEEFRQSMLQGPGNVEDEDDRRGFSVDDMQQMQQMQEEEQERELEELMRLAASSSSSASASYTDYSSSSSSSSASRVTTITSTSVQQIRPGRAPPPPPRLPPSFSSSSPPRGLSAPSLPVPPPGAMTSQQFNRVLDLLASDTAAEDAAANFRNKRLGIAVPILPGGGGSSAKLSPNHLLMVRQLVLLLRHAVRVHCGSIYSGGAHPVVLKERRMEEQR